MKNARKLHLEIDQLQVETFHTHTIAEGRGTVRGHDPVDSATVAGMAPAGGCQCQSMYNTCVGSCGPSCENSCPGRPGCDSDNETNYMTCFQSCVWVGGQANINPFC
jgi:hypothetical protein